MNRAVTTVACGFLVVSALANFLFAFALGKTVYLAAVYGAVGVLATFANALIPLRMIQAWDAKRYSVFSAGAILLPLCVAFSLTSAMGFAASVRDKGSSDQVALQANYQTALQSLREMELIPIAKRTQQQTRKIDNLRQQVIAYRSNGAMKRDDPQADILNALGIPNGRYWLSLLFALLVEAGSALGLFISLADTKIPIEPESTPWKKLT